MYKLQKSGPFWVYFLAFLPLVIWFPHSSWQSLTQIILSLGQASALSGSVLFSINFILSARFRIVENFFFGLNRVFINHHLIGGIALILLLLHPTFILSQYLILSPENAFLILVPSLDNLPNTYGLAAILTMATLLVVTLYIKLNYETWKSTHQYLGLALIFAFLHVFNTPSTVSAVPTLRYYILGMIVLGLMSFLYRMAVKYFRLTSLPYQVVNISFVGDVVKIVMKPDARQIQFCPGQFVFISFDKTGIRGESHPFSITSTPEDADISLCAKIVGDYTEALKGITPGVKVFVEGAYGRFSYEYFKNKKQIWIAGGIGITPFISMAKSVPSDYEINLFYLVNDKSELIIDEFKDNIKLTVHESNTNGHFAIENIGIENLKEYEIFICGPIPMMNSLKQQLKNTGVKASNIHTEEFALN